MPNDFNDNGLGAVLGFGYDLRVFSKVSLTPYANQVIVIIGDGSVHVWQLGVGLTVH